MRILIIAILLVSIFYTATAVEMSDTIENDALDKSTGTYHFYNYVSTVNYFTFAQDTLIAQVFDPTNNSGDTTSNGYEVVAVDTYWRTPTGEVTFYVCPDDGGKPDIAGALFTDTYTPSVCYPTQDEHAVSPPAGFSSGDLCWVVFAVTANDDKPVGDAGTGGSSYISIDGGSVWDLMMHSGGEVDFAMDVYADANSAVEGASFGGIKACFR